ncbi:DUF2946 domain-containing protein [Acinetobacter qingfengensis]|uniref:Uncharacterized protein n=1 Tax=Acinetobacter qingfengensis TaxID=1262585 RepID=A0A1E7R3G4_9GAMM|nr:DUF2946 family protein [Acinetobacter qingfengensis]KAA8735580.1 DUF2946 domain-containing protein [Acinetobacter qingfengensis]OEY93880.1 hypothetical protein BJI46_13900 [Acinetobacter qingfengensis]
MIRFGILLGILAVLLQNMVFWQALLPKKMYQNQVCIEIIHAMDHSVVPSSHHHLALQQSSLEHHVKIDSTMDCHFCQLFHSSLAISISSPQLIEIRTLMRIIYLTISWYIFFYLQRLFLCPQGRGPPVSPVFV